MCGLDVNGFVLHGIVHREVAHTNFSFHGRGKKLFRVDPRAVVLVKICKNFFVYRAELQRKGVAVVKNHLVVVFHV